jgi:hypothetical protein
MPALVNAPVPSRDYPLPIAHPVKDAKTENAALAAFGSPKFEDVSIATIGKNQIAAQRILDRVGYR